MTLHQRTNSYPLPDPEPEDDEDATENRWQCPYCEESSQFSCIQYERWSRPIYLNCENGDYIDRYEGDTEFDREEDISYDFQCTHCGAEIRSRGDTRALYEHLMTALE